MNELISPIFSMEAEQSVIGGLLLNNKAFDSIADLVTKESFYRHEHRVLFGAIAEMLADDCVVDLVTLTEKYRNDLESFGGLVYVVELMQNTPSAANIRRYAQIVADKFKARNAILKAQSFISDVQESSAEIDEQIASLARGLDDLAVSATEDSAMLNAYELMRLAVEEFDRRVQAGGQFLGLSTGLSELDKKLMGLQKGSLYILAGRPAMGKSAVSMCIAEHVADKYAKDGAVVVFNLEMSLLQIAMRSAAAKAEISLSDLQKGYGTDLNWEAMRTAIERLGDRNIQVDASPDLTVSKMRNKARKVKNKHGLSLIVIDYLGLIDEPSKSFQSDNSRISYVCRQIKLMAKELDVPVILLSQLSRKCEERSDKRPLLSDLRDSGSIEQDADAVIFCYRDGYYAEDNTDDMLELIVAKQRMGETGTAVAAWRGRYCKVIDVSDEYILRMNAKREMAKPKSKARRGI